MSDAGQERRDELASLYALGAMTDAAQRRLAARELAATRRSRPTCARSRHGRRPRQRGAASRSAGGAARPRAHVDHRQIGRRRARASRRLAAACRAASRRRRAGAAVRRAVRPSRGHAFALARRRGRADRRDRHSALYALQLRDRVARAEARAGRGAGRGRRHAARARLVAGTDAHAAHAGRRADRARHGARRSRRPAARAEGRGARVLEPPRGMVFAATSLPQLPAGKVYQVWVVADGVNPISAGLLAPDAQRAGQRALRHPARTSRRRCRRRHARTGRRRAAANRRESPGRRNRLVTREPIGRTLRIDECDTRTALPVDALHGFCRCSSSSLVARNVHAQIQS